MSKLAEVSMPPRIVPSACIVVVLLVHAFATQPAQGDDSKSRPNVLFLISDDLTAEALACFGNQDCKTPNIDGLAKRGVKFTRAYCQFPVCGPSRASLMSGLYAQVVGVTGNGKSEEFTANMKGKPSLPEYFKNAGYTTARVSKIYHMRVPGDITAGVDGPDHAASWTERYNCRAPEWMTFGFTEHIDRGRIQQIPDKHYGLGFGGAFYAVACGDGKEQADYLAAEKAMELLQKYAGEKEQKPFFLAVGLVRPHVPLVAPQDLFKAYPPSDLTLAESRKNDQADIPREGISKNSAGSGLTEDAKKQRVLQAYYASVSFMDQQVGRILEELKRLNLADTTIVVFTSDHGYHLGEHDLWQKMSLHEESTRVPVIIAAPGIAAGKSDGMFEHIDMYPTLVTLAGLEVPEHCQGVSQVPVLTGKSESVRENAYCLRSNAHLFRTPEWAYIKYPGGGVELYDMVKDPKQFTNLAGKPEHKTIQEDLDRQLQARLKAMNE